MALMDDVKGIPMYLVILVLDGMLELVDFFKFLDELDYFEYFVSLCCN